MKNHNHHKKKELVTAIVADHKGKIFDLDNYAAAGMAGASLSPLTVEETVNMPYGGELMLLPDRKPILYNIKKQQFEILQENPYEPGKPIFPVAIFNSPGYLLTSISAYTENRNVSCLPLFSYGAAGWHKNKFRTSLIRVDRERRQDLRLMQHEKVIAGIDEMKKKMPKNRLRKHLEKCAVEYGCPAGKNFFLGRYEAPLPSSQHCNAECLGCISCQKTGMIQSSQDRISFTPSPSEIAEVALEHIKKVNKSVVSFGQGCEGDPLLAADVIGSAIAKIRSVTSRGTINMNTNGSLPDTIDGLFDAGLDSVRISINSFRKKCYDAYFRPKGYSIKDVIKSIDIALGKGKFVAVNYLNMVGFTDTPEEFEAFTSFLKNHPVNLIQWRNLNFDPLRYWQLMYELTAHGKPMGMKRILKQTKKIFPALKFGYFNPPKENF